MPMLADSGEGFVRGFLIFAGFGVALTVFILLVPFALALFAGLVSKSASSTTRTGNKPLVRVLAFALGVVLLVIAVLWFSVLAPILSPKVEPRPVPQPSASSSAPPPAPAAPPSEAGFPDKPAHVKKGDWCLLRSGGGRIFYRVTAVRDDQLELAYTRTDKGNAEASLSLRDPEWLHYRDLSERLGIHACAQLWDIASVETGQGALTIASRTFACTKVSFQATNRGGEPGGVTVWFCPEVAAPGIVAIDFFGTRVAELVGFGSSEGEPWGGSADDFPSNPLENATPGDWEAIAFQQRNDRWTDVFEVQRVEGDSVDVVVREQDGAGGSVRSTTTLHLSRAKAPNVRAVLLPSWGLRGHDLVAVQQDSVNETLGERVSCTRLRADFGMGEGSGYAMRYVHLSLSPEIKCLGIVRVKVVSADPEITTELVGHGTKDRVLWGSKPGW